MKVLIIEDESRAANHLERLLGKVAPQAEVLAKLESVREGIDFLTNSTSPDLILSDIQLADGLSFEIYQAVEVPCPIVFATAYDQYAIEAFQTNGVDYLLKPIDESRLKAALDKVDRLAPRLPQQLLQQLLAPSQSKTYRRRFLVKVGDELKTIPVDQVKAFYSLEKATFLLTEPGRKYIVDHSMGEVESMLDPKLFFRISRKHIVGIDACSQIHAFTNSRLILKVSGLEGQDVIVARERVGAFKNWLGA